MFFLEQLLRQDGTEQNHLAELLCHLGLSLPVLSSACLSGFTSGPLQLSQDWIDSYYQNQSV